MYQLGSFFHTILDYCVYETIKIRMTTRMDLDISPTLLTRSGICSIYTCGLYVNASVSAHIGLFIKKVMIDFEPVTPVCQNFRIRLGLMHSLIHGH